MSTVIEVKNVRKNYKSGKVDYSALKDVSLSVEKGEMICLMGPSGSGKTTLLNIMSCVDSYDSGTVLIHGNDISAFSDNHMSDFRNRKIGFIFQSFNLIPVLTAFENIEYPLVIQKLPKKIRKARVDKIMSQLGVFELAPKKPDELSGGQRQRVAIARALVIEPEIIMADEPTSALDHETGTGIMNLIRQINKDMQTTFIFSTHDPLVSGYASRIVKMQDGKIIE